ncbi:MAG: DUF2812 domain-containing protein [Oscillospiraceae bacterium]|nr:DUF2812 domain-containing protein [Oscillospiraceae bacterium]
MNNDQNAPAEISNTPYTDEFINKFRKHLKTQFFWLLGCIAAGIVSFFVFGTTGWFFFSLVLGAAFGLGGWSLACVIHYLRRVWMFKNARRPTQLCELGHGLGFSEAKDMEMCEAMAANGYALVKVNSLGYYKFERAHPAAMTYSADYSDLKRKSEGFSEYIDIFQSGGWEYVYSQDTIHWFRAPKGTTPIYTDSASIIQKHKKMRKIMVLGTLICALWVVAFAGLIYFLDDLPFGLTTTLFAAAGGGAGAGLTMFAGIFLNHRRVIRLERQQREL